MAFLERKKKPTPAFSYECLEPSKLAVRILWILYAPVLRADVALYSFGIKYCQGSFQAKNYLPT